MIRQQFLRLWNIFFLFLDLAMSNLDMEPTLASQTSAESSKSRAVPTI